ncbi:hypothetical protein BKA81DRAFT_28035 [Phyllosticta paracitricarpa]|uniref:Secreted protein n=1 Tax=Phyllosticta paracitricarpa TaxID=2016321 RepID=A0ABR1NKW5_9PEZI
MAHILRAWSFFGLLQPRSRACLVSSNPPIFFLLCFLQDHVMSPCLFVPLLLFFSSGDYCFCFCIGSGELKGRKQTFAFDFSFYRRRHFFLFPVSPPALPCPARWRVRTDQSLRLFF